MVDGEEVYSKFKTGRHANPGEVLQLLVERWPPPSAGN